MQAVVLSPTPSGLAEVTASRRDGPARWVLSPQERRDRVRASITNAGFALPTGDVEVVMNVPDSPSLDLAVALAVLLADPSHEHLRRFGWIAWGTLGLDGSLGPAADVLVNELPAQPCAGRIWEPDDRIPSADEDAVISLFDVGDLRQAWDVITFLAGAEEVILGGGSDRRAVRARPSC